MVRVSIRDSSSLVGASLSELHTSELPPRSLHVIDHSQKMMTKLGNLHVHREFNGDYVASLYGSCNRPCHDK